MRAFVFALVGLIVAAPVEAKTKEPASPQAPVVALHDRPAACKLTYDGELRDAHDTAAKHSVGVYPLSGADVAKFLAIFNAAEPKTDFKAEQILILSTHEIAFIEMFKNGCANHFGKVAPAAFESLMDAAFGDDVVDGEWM